MKSLRFVVIGCALVAGLGLCGIAFVAVLAHEQGWRAIARPLAGIAGDSRFGRTEDGGERRREDERKSERTEPRNRDSAAPTKAFGATAVPSSGRLDPLPASHAGRSTCIACHETGSADPQYPADHVGRADSTCAACHWSTGTAPSTVAPTSAPATPTATSANPSAKSLPANHSGRTTCNACHATGTAGPQSPADHAGRADSSCVTCHQLK
jgi:hypothetical protein